MTSHMHQLRQCVLFRSAVLAMWEKVYQWSYQNPEKRKEDGNTLGLSAVKYMVYFCLVQLVVCNVAADAQERDVI